MSQQLSYRVRRLFNDRPNVHFKPHPWTRIINWGNSGINDRSGLAGDRLSGISGWVNPCSQVRLAGNKLVTFQTLEGKDGIRIPEFTTDREVAAAWIGNGSSVVCRTVLTGHSGDGIVLANEAGALVPAPLYVKYVKKQKEFRVHVAFGEVIDVQEKRQQKEYEGDTNFQVRNHQTGWVYCREDIVEPAGLRDMACKTVSLLGLDFGAVDLIFNAKRNECYCLEVNTAPGLEGTTVDKYATAFVRNLTK